MTSIFTVKQAKCLKQNGGGLDALNCFQLRAGVSGGFVDAISDVANHAIMVVAANVSADHFRQASLNAVAQGMFLDLAPLRMQLEKLAGDLDTDDADARRNALQIFEKALPEIFVAVRKNSAADDALLNVLTSAAVNGVAGSVAVSNEIAYSSPVPSSDALDYLKQKTTIPTELRTWALDKLPVELRERMAFSAGVTKAEFIDSAYDKVRELTEGIADRATMRLELKQLLARMDYKPRKGAEGGLLDLSSDRRLNLILDTNLAQCQSYADNEASQDPALLDAFPAYEFTRVEARDDPRTNWSARWDAARAQAGAEGATASGSGRMVALKNHPIWSALSRFGTPYEPYDFNSGMGREDVDRDASVDLGIIGKDEQVKPEHRSLNEMLQSSPNIRSAALRRELEATGLGRFDSEGVFRWEGGEK